mmetsp:Transcript_63451/g.182123  ORF Transcript_63451/g.182123 Transcript_63451/m.182123 type:complete len:212 (+) Transcript_63451:63-698(+)
MNASSLRGLPEVCQVRVVQAALCPEVPRPGVHRRGCLDLGQLDLREQLGATNGACACLEVVELPRLEGELRALLKIVRRIMGGPSVHPVATKQPLHQPPYLRILGILGCLLHLRRHALRIHLLASDAGMRPGACGGEDIDPARKHGPKLRRLDNPTLQLILLEGVQQCAPQQVSVSQSLELIPRSRRHRPRRHDHTLTHKGLQEDGGCSQP